MLCVAVLLCTSIVRQLNRTGDFRYSVDNGGNVYSAFSYVKTFCPACVNEAVSVFGKFFGAVADMRKMKPVPRHIIQLLQRHLGAIKVKRVNHNAAVFTVCGA